MVVAGWPGEQMISNQDLRCMKLPVAYCQVPGDWVLGMLTGRGGGGGGSRSRSLMEALNPEIVAPGWYCEGYLPVGVGVPFGCVVGGCPPSPRVARQRIQCSHAVLVFLSLSLHRRRPRWRSPGSASPRRIHPSEVVSTNPRRPPRASRSLSFAMPTSKPIENASVIFQLHGRKGQHGTQEPMKTVSLSSTYSAYRLNHAAPDHRQGLPDLWQGLQDRQDRKWRFGVRPEAAPENSIPSTKITTRMPPSKRTRTRAARLG